MCKEFCGTKAHDTNFIIKFLTGINYKLHKDEVYRNAYTKMKMMCDVGHDIQMTWTSLQAGSRCNDCANERTGTKRRLSLFYISEYISNEGDKLISKEYQTNVTPIEIECHICFNPYITTWQDFQSGQRCVPCSRMLFLEQQRVKFEKEFDVILDQINYKKIGKYKNVNTPLELECDKQHKINIRPSAIKRGGRCSECHKLSRKGANHWNYNPDREYIAQNRRLHKKYYKMIRRLMVNKSIHSAAILAYTCDELMIHLQSFSQWESIKNDYQIDHIFPQNAFQKLNINDPKIVCALDNLQPLSPEQNQKKRDKFDPPAFREYLDSHNIQYDHLLFEQLFINNDQKIIKELQLIQTP